MDFRDNWFTVSEEKNYKYNIVCKECEKEFTINQKGEDISFLMDYIISKYHIKNTIDQVFEYYPDEYDCKNIKLDLEIFKNTKCTKKI
jgi:hypothetical protein